MTDMSIMVKFSTQHQNRLPKQMSKIGFKILVFLQSLFPSFCSQDGLTTNTPNIVKFKKYPTKRTPFLTNLISDFV
jgi:hypothetical protein